MNTVSMSEIRHAIQQLEAAPKPPAVMVGGVPHYEVPRHPYADVWQMIREELAYTNADTGVRVSARLLGLSIPLHEERRKDFLGHINRALFHPRGMTVWMVSYHDNQLHVRIRR